MRIVKLTKETTENILENMLKRSPTQYGTYEASVQEIIENVKTNSFKFASNILATNKLINCDNITPIPKPMTSEMMPINNVSKNKIIDIFLLLIPKVR